MAVPDPDSPSNRQLQAAAVLLASLSPRVTELGELFAAAGHEVALVGGPVRDAFLRRTSPDIDLTTDAPPERILELTAGWADATWTIGIEFGTIGLRKGGTTFEVTTYRSDSYDRTSRKPAVTYGRSLAEDLSRRDFTVNAMAARLPGYQLVDPFGGVADLRAKVLRTPGSPETSFTDDPLRILRAARFAAQLGFTVAPDVRVAMTDLAGLLAPPKVSAERIEGELTKLVRSALAGGPAAGIALLTETGVADLVLPEIPALRLEKDEHFRHKDVYQHTLTVLTQAIELEPRYGLEQDLVLRLAALLHDIGKPRTRSRLPGGRVAFHHHEVVGAQMARKRLSQLRYGKDVVADVSKLVELHLRFHGYGEGEWTDSAVRRYVNDAGPLLTRLHALTRADCTTRNKAKAQRLAGAYDHLEARIAELAAQEELDKIRPDIDGNEIMAILGIPPGPIVGQAWAYLKELRMERGPLDHDTAVAELLAWAKAQGLEIPERDDPEAGA
ncbi:MAG TPA: CCA tRNA nucleotidyltransferase [Streptosporangiaceae bacterium]|nr:CCA tRNA nucleotidyltransferase [Streptosporangiaceae bacterium]